MDDIPQCSCSDCNNFFDVEPSTDIVVVCNKFGMTHWHNHCMLHHQAREYLMKDVIEELERRKTLYPIPGDAYSIGKIDAFSEVIKIMVGKVDAFNESIDLIKNGVDKK